MKSSPLIQQWKEFQLNRVQKIYSWYAEHYEHAYVGDKLIKYIVLWSVFNALYNTYDLPNNKLPEKINGRFRFRNRFGYKVPVINVSRDFDRVKKFAEKLAQTNGLVELINQREVRHRINVFVDRIPHVAQNEDIDRAQDLPIIIQGDDGRWIVEDTFSPRLIRGVSSLDHRLFLSDGYIFFEYAAIERPWNHNGELTDIDRTTNQLLTVLYQLRNNVVHGGVVSDKRKSIINDALPILQKIVEFVFANADLIYSGEKK